jgi:PAS domain S-box-containing protein
VLKLISNVEAEPTALPDLDWESVFSTLPEAVLLGDAQGLITYANPAAEALLGWPAGDLAGRSITELIPAPMRAQHERGFRRYQHTGVARVMGRPIRVPVLRRNGTEVRLELILEALPSGEYFLATLRPPRAGARPADGAATRILSALRAAREALGGAHDWEAVPRVITDLLVHHFGARLARIWVYDETSGFLRQPARVRRRSGVPEALPTDLRLADDAFVVAEVGRTQTAFLKNGLEESADFDPAWIEREGLHAAALLPLAHVGVLRGVTAYFSSEPISGEFVQLLEIVASMAAAALAEAERARVSSALESAERWLSDLAALLRELSGGAPELVDRILQLALVYAEADLVLLAVREGSEMVVQADSGFGASIAGYVYPEGLGIAREALRGSDGSVEDYLGYPAAIPPLRQRGVRSALAIPVGENAVLKALRKRGPAHFAERERERLAALAACLRIALEARDRARVGRT